MYYLLKLLHCSFLYDIGVNKQVIKINVKKNNNFAFMINQVSKFGVSGRWLIETNIKHFKNVTLRKI